jgi:aspartate/methionine/tyrosine aminotransferase
VPRVAVTSLSTPHSAIREIGARAAANPDALRLEIGDPTFTTAQHIIEAAELAAREGFTRYTPSAGLPTLRELLVEKLARINGVTCQPEQVVVTTGGCGAIFATLLVLLDPGDEVLMPDPGWPNYPAMAHMLNAKGVFYPLSRDKMFEPDFDELEARITPRSKVLIVNSPSNPTGQVASQEVVERLAAIAERHDLWLLSDECYDQLIFEGEHVEAARFADPERLVSVFSFSKTYAMTGWRIGYLVTQPDLASSIAKTQESVVLNAASTSQKAAEAALTGPQDHLEEMRSYYRDRRDAAVAQLDRAGVTFVSPRGAFYLMVDLAPGVDDQAFAFSLLESKGVAVVPGTGFGPSAKSMVRLSLSVAPEVLDEGVRRLADAIAAQPDSASVLTS